MNHQQCLLIIITCVALCVGCGSSETSPRLMTHAASPVTDLKMDSPGPARAVQNSVAEQTAASSESVAPEILRERVVRKIIYNASVSLVVESFDGVAVKVAELAEQCGGFVAAANLSGASGNQRSGSWTIRLPVEHYRSFLNSAGNLGEIHSKTEQTREVTAEYYDIEARIRNKQTEERRLISLLEERPGKLDEILAVEKEISRVRGEIEQKQGQLRMLADLTTFSTVTLQISEVRNYVPPESPSFQTRIAREWQSTVESLTEAGQSLVLLTIRVGPWLLIFLMFAFPAWLILRRSYKGRLVEPQSGGS